MLEGIPWLKIDVESSTLICLKSLLWYTTHYVTRGAFVIKKEKVLIKSRQATQNSLYGAGMSSEELGSVFDGLVRFIMFQKDTWIQSKEIYFDRNGEDAGFTLFLCQPGTTQLFLNEEKK